ncbi:MAG: hypothetical protein KC416_07775, partial [Myxococcales bacterium]|nr:hypothetical protein [Myxococcales bacterium]
MRFLLGAVFGACFFVSWSAPVLAWESLAPGVEYQAETLPGPHRMRVIRIDACTPGVRLRATAYAERGKRTSTWASS